jgi:hypothetical protein
MYVNHLHTSHGQHMGVCHNRKRSTHLPRVSLSEQRKGGSHGLAKGSLKIRMLDKEISAQKELLMEVRARQRS